MTRYELSKRLEFLMRIGLVDRSRLQQYKLAFKDPENNLKFQHYRSKILEVFFKIFDIIQDNDPIFEKVRQQVILRYRNQRPMKKKKQIKEAAPKRDKRKFTRAQTNKLNAFRTKLNKLHANDKHDEIINTHSNLSKKKPDRFTHQEWIAHRVVATTAAGRAKQAKVAQRDAELKKIDQAAKDAKKDFKPVSKEVVPMASSPEEIARAEKRRVLGSLKSKNLDTVRKYPDLGNVPETKKKSSFIGRIASKLTGKKMNEMASIGPSGASERRKTMSSAMKGENERRQREAEAKRNASQRQREQEADRSRAKAQQNNIKRENRGKPTT